jgi:hypothetical protein
MLIQTPRRFRAQRGGNPHWPLLEDRVNEFISSERIKGKGISTTQIILHAKVFAKEMGIEDFKGTPSWCCRFMKRNNLVIRSVTSLAQSLPEDWRNKVASFREYVKDNINDVLPLHFGNMDEVPVSFDMPRSRTVETKGVKEVRLSTTGHEKSNFTVILAITAKGGKLPPMVIFKRKTIPKENFPTNIHIEANEKGWVNEEIMKNWIDKVWKRRPASFFKPSSLLIFDSCRAHITENVKKYVERESKLAVIPGGLTPKLQPLDIAVNRSFKTKLRAKWETWMLNQIHEYTASGKIKRVSYKEICEWIVKSWDEVPLECVLNGFKKMMNDEDINEIENDNQNEDLQVNLNGNFDVDSDSNFDGFN